jgi:hypothetical protein
MYVYVGQSTSQVPVAKAVLATSFGHAFAYQRHLEATSEAAQAAFMGKRSGISHILRND